MFDGSADDRADSFVKAAGGANFKRDSPTPFRLVRDHCYQMRAQSDLPEEVSSNVFGVSYGLIEDVEIDRHLIES